MNFEETGVIPSESPVPEVWHCWNTPTTGPLCGAEGVYLNITEGDSQVLHSVNCPKCLEILALVPETPRFVATPNPYSTHFMTSEMKYPQKFESTASTIPETVAVDMTKIHETEKAVLADRRGKPTLLGKAVFLLEQAQVDRRLAGVIGSSSYYAETQEFLHSILEDKAS